MTANDVRYTKDHEWLRREADGTFTVGITDFAQQQLGDVVFVQLPDVGAKFGVGEEAAVVESVKAASEIKMPLAGIVTAVNAGLPDTPTLVNEDPMGRGWFMQIKPDEPADVATLMVEADYAKHIQA